MMWVARAAASVVCDDEVSNRRSGVRRTWWTREQEQKMWVPRVFQRPFTTHSDTLHVFRAWHVRGGVGVARGLRVGGGREENKEHDWEEIFLGTCETGLDASRPIERGSSAFTEHWTSCLAKGEGATIQL